MSRKGIAVVVPYYCGAVYLPRLCASLTEDERRVALVIVDNSPVESALEPAIVQRAAILLRTGESIGFGRAVNVGALFAADELGAEVVVVANQDGAPKEGCIRRLASVVRDGLLDIAAPVQTSPETGLPSKHFVRNYMALNPELVADALHGTLKPSYETPFISGACLAFLSSMLDTLGLFEPVYHMYGEDNELLRRLKRNGGTCGIVPAAEFEHEHSNSGGGDSRILSWIQSAGTVRHLTESDASLPADIARTVFRRGAHYARAAATGRFPLVRHYLEDDRRLIRDMDRILERRRRGDASVVERMRAQASADLRSVHRCPDPR